MAEGLAEFYENHTTKDNERWLEDCPCCGGGARNKHVSRGLIKWKYISICVDCGLRTRLCDSQEEATSIWNARNPNRRGE